MSDSGDGQSRRPRGPSIWWEWDHRCVFACCLLSPLASSVGKFAAYVFNPWDHLPAQLPRHIGTVGDVLPMSNPHRRLFLYCNTGLGIAVGVGGWAAGANGHGRPLSGSPYSSHKS